MHAPLKPADASCWKMVFICWPHDT